MEGFTQDSLASSLERDRIAALNNTSDPFTRSTLQDSITRSRFMNDYSSGTFGHKTYESTPDDIRRYTEI